MSDAFHREVLRLLRARVLVAGLLGCLLCASAQATVKVVVPTLDRAVRSPSQPAAAKFVYINVGTGKLVKEKSGQYVLEFVITLSRPSQHLIRVGLKTDGVTAKAGKDFSNKSEQISFKPGQTSYTFDVPLVVNPKNENSEFFYLKEVDPVGAQLGNGEGLGLIHHGF